MKKNLVLFILILLVGSTLFFLFQKNEKISDIALSNIEALASDESDTGIGWSVDCHKCRLIGIQEGVHFYCYPGIGTCYSTDGDCEGGFCFKQEWE